MNNERANVTAWQRQHLRCLELIHYWRPPHEVRPALMRLLDLSDTIATEHPLVERLAATHAPLLGVLATPTRAAEVQELRGAMAEALTAWDHAAAAILHNATGGTVRHITREQEAPRG